MWFWDDSKKVFLNKIFDVIDANAIAISDEQYNFLSSAQKRGCVIYCENNQMKVSSPRPSVSHKWDDATKDWVFDEDKYKKVMRDTFISSIDDTAAQISLRWTRFEAEYKARESAAKEYIDSNYTITPSTYITSFSRRAGIDDKTAAQKIMHQAQGLRDLLQSLADQRMRKYELRKGNLTIEQMQTIYDDIIQKMNELMGAHQNG